LMCVGDPHSNRPDDRGYRRVVRTGFILALAAIVVAYFLVPRVANGAALNRSVWEPQNKYDSYGHRWVLTALVTGDLLDLNRLPIVTVLAAIGLAHALVRRQRADRAASLLFVAWLILFFGRPTWGVLYRLLPLSNDLHLHRFVGGVHFAAIALAGLGLEQIVGLWEAFRSPLRAALATAAVVVLLIPVVGERAVYMSGDASMIAKNAAALSE